MTALDTSSPEREKKLLLIGDTIIDKTVYGKSVKISPEAPVPVFLKDPGGTVETLGGASLAASFATKNNIPVTFYTVACEKSFLMMNNANIDGQCLPIAKNVVKLRYIDSTFNQHLLRVDNDNEVEKDKIDQETMDVIWFYIYEKIIEKEVDGIVLLDYCKGFFDDEDSIQKLIKISNLNNIPIYVDSRADDLSKYKGVSMLKVNEAEFAAACSAFNISSFSPPWDLRRAMNVDNLIITKGKEGADLYPGVEGVAMSSYCPDLEDFSGHPDVTGCGDVFDVTFCWNWCINNDEAEVALQKAVDTATEYAYQPIEERLHANTR